MSNNLRKLKRKSEKEKMTVNFDQPLVDLKGQPIDGTLRQVCVNSLTNVIPGDDQIDAKTKYEWFSLAKKIENSTDSLDVKSEDVTLLKNRISKLFNVLVYGSAADLLENRTEDVAKNE